MLMNLDNPYQNWRRILYPICETDSWKHL